MKNYLGLIGFSVFLLMNAWSIYNMETLLEVIGREKCGAETETMDKSQIEANASSTAESNVSLTTSRVSMFEKIQEKLYEKATVPVHNPDRKKFTLEGWEKGNGGLLDSDRLLLGEIYYNSSSVFEFGLGESTRIAAYTGVPRFSGVDSDAVWVANARKEAGMDHFRLFFADIGNTESYGTPANETLQKIQYSYQVAPLLVERDAFDMYLVDGRYRIACACMSMLHAMSHGGDMTKVMVAIHDSDRPDYNKHFGKVAQVIHKAAKLWVYKLKDGITEENIYQVWEETFMDKGR